jgi:putative DNA primase/helicase
MNLVEHTLAENGLLDPKDCKDWQAFVQIQLEEHAIITLTDTEEMFYYNKETGLYESFEKILATEIQKSFGVTLTVHAVNEIFGHIKRQTYKDRKIIGGNLNLIPLLNGVFDFTTETLLPHSSENIFLTKHPITYIPRQETTEKKAIEKFLDEVTETPEHSLLIMEMIGYCFYREMPFQNFFLLLGSGSNGKSVLLKVITAMLGRENISSISLQELTDGRFSAANLYNKNANLFGDLPKKAFNDVGKLKQATGGDLLTAELKFKNHFSFYNYAKIIASCNEVPETPDTTDAFFRRVVMIKFPNCFEGKEDRQLIDKLTQPELLSDFFIKCISAFKEALKDGKLIINESTALKKVKYLLHSNSAIAFCNDFLDYDPDSFLEYDEVINKYKTFCLDNKVPEKNDVHFCRDLYQFFGHKVWKKKEKSDNFGEKERHYYLLMALAWKEIKKAL